MDWPGSPNLKPRQSSPPGEPAGSAGTTLRLSPHPLFAMLHGLWHLVADNIRSI